MKIIGFALTAFLIAACATKSAQTTPDIKAELGLPQPGKAVLVTYRREIKPYYHPVNAQLDGESFAELGNWTYRWAYLEPGDYSLATYWPKGALIPRAERQITLEAEKYYLVEMRGAGISVAFKKKELNPSNTQLKIGSYQQALKWLDNCCRLTNQAQNSPLPE